MSVLKEIPVKIDPGEVLRSLNHGRVSAQLLEATGQAVERAQALIEPAVVYDWFEVRAVHATEVLVARDPAAEPARFEVGLHADLLASARRVLISVLSIGPRLDVEVRRLNQAGEHLAAYLLDSVGVVGLSHVGDRVRELAEMAAAARGWGVSASLSPGSLAGWPLSGQRDLCTLLPLEKIAVRLNDSAILVPFKSVSSVIGIGAAYTDRRVGSVCRFCSHAPTCWRYRPTSTMSCE